MSRWFLPFLLLACQNGDPVRDGTFVGNPGKMDVAVSEVPTEVVLTDALVLVDAVELVDCEGGVEGTPIDAIFDALGGREDAVAVPGGEFCAATLFPAQDGVTVVGETASGTAFTLVLDPGPLDLDDPLAIDETDLLWTLSLAGLDAAAIDALGPDPAIPSDDPIALDTTEVIVRTTSLYEDLDADGLVSTGDALAASADPNLDLDPTAYAADAGCGCASSGGPAGLWVLGLIALAARRRNGREPG